jgi:hypothetical protein
MTHARASRLHAPLGHSSIVPSQVDDVGVTHNDTGHVVCPEAA